MAHGAHNLQDDERSAVELHDYVRPRPPLPPAARRPAERGGVVVRGRRAANEPALRRNDAPWGVETEGRDVSG
jgi:hypothetical protein